MRVESTLHPKLLVALDALVPDLLVYRSHVGPQVALAGRLELALWARVPDPQVDLLLVKAKALQCVGDIVAVLALELDPAVEGLYVLVEGAGRRGLEVAVVARVLDTLVDGLDVLLEVAGRGGLVVAVGTGVPQAQVYGPVVGLETVAGVGNIVALLARVLVPAVERLDVSGEGTGAGRLEVTVITRVLDLLVDRSYMNLYVA